MTKEQAAVLEFHQKAGLRVNNIPFISSQEDADLRVKLIQEELNELAEALEKRDLIETADALGDLLYVVYGAGVTFGIDLEPVFAEIHRSNMTKFRWKHEDLVKAHVAGYTVQYLSPQPASEWYDAVVKNEYGKVIKPPTYSPANLNRMKP